MFSCCNIYGNIFHYFNIFSCANFLKSNIISQFIFISSELSLAQPPVKHKINAQIEIRIRFFIYIRLSCTCVIHVSDTPKPHPILNSDSFYKLIFFIDNITKLLYIQPCIKNDCFLPDSKFNK